MSVNKYLSAINIGPAGSQGAIGATGATGPTGLAGANSLNDLSDVAITGATGTQILQFNGTNFVNVDLSLSLFDFSVIPSYDTAIEASGALDPNELYVLTGDDTIRRV